jgi:hypothetical protein
MMKQILKAGPNQMETLRRLRTEAEAVDKDVMVRSERIRQTRDFRIRFWFREKRWNRASPHHSIRIHHTQARAATKRAEWRVRRSALAHLPPRERVVGVHCGQSAATLNHGESRSAHMANRVGCSTWGRQFGEMDFR